MDHKIVSQSPEKLKTGCTIVGVFEKGKLSPSADKLNKAGSNFLTKILKRGDFTGVVGETMLCHNVPELNCERLLLVGCGVEKDLTNVKYRKVVNQAILALQNTKAKDILNCLTELTVKDRDMYWKVRQILFKAPAELARV